MCKWLYSIRKNYSKSRINIIIYLKKTTKKVDIRVFNKFILKIKCRVLFIDELKVFKYLKDFLVIYLPISNFLLYKLGF